MRLRRRVRTLYPTVWAAPVIALLILALVSATWGRTATLIVLGFMVALLVGWVVGAGLDPAPLEHDPDVTTPRPGVSQTAGSAEGRGTLLTGADLTDADLTGADLRGLDLRGVNLTRAVLRQANLRGARLSSLTGTDTGQEG